MKRIVLSLDPSGNFIDGKGHTGLVLAEVYDDFSFTVIHKETIRADKFDTRMEYWRAHMDALDPELDLVIIEDFMLYPHISQGFSYMETPRLLGVLEVQADLFDIPVVFQRAANIAAWSNEVLIGRGFLEKRKGRYWHDKKIYNDHERSALKHLVFWLNKEKKNEYVPKENQPQAVRIPERT
jgi:hypothetical protein